MTRALLFAAALTLLIPFRALPARKGGAPTCTAPAPASVDSAHALGAAVIEVLGRVRRGIERMPEGPRDASEVVSILGAVRDDVACACKVLEPFARSGAAGIRDTARDLGGTCAALRDTTAGMATALKAQAAGAAGADARMTRAIEEKDRAWGDFLVAAGKSLGVLVELRDGRPTGVLRVTRVERGALRSDLEGAFGKGLGSGGAEDPDPLTTVAAGWYGVLTNPAYRASDDG